MMKKLTYILIVILLISGNVFSMDIKKDNSYIYEGIYKLDNNLIVEVIAVNGKLKIKLNNGNLLDYSDTKTDVRVLEVERKTRELIQATIENDRKKIAELFIKSPVDTDMKDFIDGFIDVMQPALKANPDRTDFQIITTIYRDEDSNYGFEDEGWGWETYILFKGIEKNIYARIIWDGPTGKHIHRGIAKSPPIKSELEFSVRLPSRSWIKAYDPKSQTITKLRDVSKNETPDMIPARFVAYDIETHNTVGVRFRKNEKHLPMRIEIGPLGSKVLVNGIKIE